MTGQQFTVEVFPRVPERLARLTELADDLWYSWHRPARALFGSLHPMLWSEVGHNPKLFLRRVDEDILLAAAQDEVFLASYARVLASFDAYHENTDRQENAARLTSDDLVAYFCAEYGLHESLPVYSGGLGILAGHHCKSASDFRLPFVAVGLLYQAGYFAQEINADGEQVAKYLESDFSNLPINKVYDANGEPVRVCVEFPGREVCAQVWSVQVGHVRVYLLDTNIDANRLEDRKITHQLYGGDRETRIKQELVLGIGGVRALRALGLAPTVWHMNEGHPAFSVLERMRELRGAGASFEAALEAVAGNCVFTTHTPVPAGHDYFPDQMARGYLEPMVKALGCDVDQVLDLGRMGAKHNEFNMTTLALRGSRHQNGVSRIHGSVSSALCAQCWPQVSAADNPISYITNGVHIPTVLAPEWSELFDQYLGPEWRSHFCDDSFWQRLHEIPDHLFWSVNQAIKSKLLTVLRAALTTQYLRNQVSEPHVERMLRHIDPSDPNVLTIGFARRFATYKRATLIFQDLAWLRELVDGTERPVVFLFSGKAHPADGPGRLLVQEIHRLTNEPEFVGKVLLLEGYDLGLARRLFAGVDVWLNTPVYPMEASGTSGMKAAVNGTVNLSVIDGWWGEGFERDNGWGIRPSPHNDDEARRDAEDARTLYEILQDEVIPAYYDRGKHGFSQKWVRLAKRSMESVLPKFNMSRVVNEYIECLYQPAATRGRALTGADLEAASELAGWKSRVRDAWPGVELRATGDGPDQLTYGEQITLTIEADLNGLAAEDVVVEAIVRRHSESEGPVPHSHLMDEEALSAVHAQTVRNESSELRFRFIEMSPAGKAVFTLYLSPQWCGLLSYKIRLYPYHAGLVHRFETGLMAWV